MKADSAIKMMESKDYEEANLYIYQQVIDKLMYLAWGTKPDISFVVGQLSRYNVDLRKAHLRAARKIV